MGQMIPTIMLAVRKAGGAGLIYLQYIFRTRMSPRLLGAAGKANLALRKN